MPYGQAKEILNYASEFHKKAGEFYQRVADKEQSARVKLLLDYMVRHEKHLERTLNEYDKNVSSKALDAWYQYAKENQTFAALESIKYSDNMSVNDIMKIGTTIDNCLITSYKGIVETAATPEIREIFENLLAMEEQQKHVKARAALGINDM